MSDSLSSMDCSPQALLSTGFSQQEYWSGLPFPPPGDLPDPGIKTTFPAPPAVHMDFLPPSHQGSSFPSLSEVAQSYPTLCDPMDCSLLPSSFVHGIFQARVLEWVAISFSRASSRPRDQTWVSCIAGRCFTI